MTRLEDALREILTQELKYLQKFGVVHLGFRYFLPNGKSFGRPTIQSWYGQTRTADFYEHQKFYLTKELIYLTEHKFCYVTRANDQEDSQYLTWLQKLGLNNSVGIYKFQQSRIDSFFFICEANSGKQRDDLINNMQWLEHHVNSLTNQINKIPQEIIDYPEEDFSIDKSVCEEIFKHCSASAKFSTCCIDIMLSGKQISISSRELEVLQFLKFGESNKIIAFKLGVNERTIERQLYNLKEKFCLNSKSELITIANSPQLQTILY